MCLAPYSKSKSPSNLKGSKSLNIFSRKSLREIWRYQDTDRKSKHCPKLGNEIGILYLNPVTAKGRFCIYPYLLASKKKKKQNKILGAFIETLSFE